MTLMLSMSLGFLADCNCSPGGFDDTENQAYLWH